MWEFSFLGCICDGFCATGFSDVLFFCLFFLVKGSQITKKVRPDIAYERLSFPQSLTAEDGKKSIWQEQSGKH